MKSFILLSFLAVVAAVDKSDYADVDPDFIEFPADGIDYPGCFQDLVVADRNKDGVVKSNEYLQFIQEYGKRICHSTDQLSLEQSAAFNALACRCRSREGSSDDCCLGDNAQIETAGALNTKRTKEEQFYLTAVCTVTDGTIEEPRGCPPKIIKPDDPPPFVFVTETTTATPPPPPATPPPPPAGLSKGAKAGIIVGSILGALLLLALCCFCCVWRRRRQNEKEEEELEEKVAVTEDVEQAPELIPASGQRSMNGPDVGAAPSTAPPNMSDPASALASLGPAAVAAAGGPPPAYEEEEEEGGARGGRNLEDEEDDEEVRKGRGSDNFVPADVDPGRKIRGAGQLPPHDPNGEGIQLKPIPDKEKEEEGWDYPGREINYPKDSDEMSAGHVDHYEPDGGVYFPERPGKEPLDWKNKWQRPEVEDPDDTDNRKHRIQAGLGEGEVWDKLENGDDEASQKGADTGAAFDWVVQSALGVLDKSDEAGHLTDDEA